MKITRKSLKLCLKCRTNIIERKHKANLKRITVLNINHSDEDGYLCQKCLDVSRQKDVQVSSSTCISVVPNLQRCFYNL